MAKLACIGLGLLLLALTCFMHGCGTREGMGRLETSEVIEWPSPPEKPRIRFLYAFSTAEDLGIRRSLLSRIVGAAEHTMLKKPIAITVNEQGLIFVADQAGALHMFDVRTGKSRVTSMCAIGTLVSPVALLAEGDSLYVVDSALGALFVYDRNLQNSRLLSGVFKRPTAVVREPGGEALLVLDAGEGQIVRIPADDSTPGILKVATDTLALNTPTHLWSTPEALFITDSYNFRVLKNNNNGELTGRYGKQGNAMGCFARPKGVATDSDGHIYIVDALFGNVQIFKSTGQLLLFFGESGSKKPGEFSLPTGIFIDSKDRIYIADTFNSRIQVFQYLNSTESTP